MAPSLPEEYPALVARLEASRQELLDLGMRNPLLNFRYTKAQGVAVVQEESAQVLEILVRQGKTMYFLAAPEPPKKADKTGANADAVYDVASSELPALETYYSEHPPVLPTEAEFWQVGWFNYEVQDEAELTRVLAYMRGNARQTGLAGRFQEWPYVND